MIRISPLLAAAASAAVLAGCSARLDEAGRAAPTASAFDGALQAGYIRLARAELDELDLVDTDAFADRALRLARGERVLPEALAARSLPATAAADLARSRTRLIAALDRGGRERAPLDAAEAQLRFDCWMQEQEENFQADDISACRAGFLAAVDKIETATPVLARSRAPTPRPMPAGAETSTAPAKPRNFTVMFAFDSARIDAGGKLAIGEAVAAYKAFGAAIIRVAGHSDRAGTEAYNATLARARAEAVARAIGRAGVPANLVRVRSFGESRPAVPTKDGERDGRNRRVEIIVDPEMPRTAIRR